MDYKDDMTEYERLEKISHVTYGIVACISEFYRGIETSDPGMMHSGAVTVASWANMLLDLLPEELRCEREAEQKAIEEAYYKYR